MGGPSRAVHAFIGMGKNGLTIYTDGASRKDKRGGWGYAIYVQGEEVQYDYGGARNTTIGRMELMGPIKALQSLKRGREITIVSDSQYVVKGITDHLDSWLRAGWRGTGNKEIKNQDLWEILGHLDCDYRVTWEWVKGHSGVLGNERADYLAGLGVPEK